MNSKRTKKHFFTCSSINGIFITMLMVLNILLWPLPQSAQALLEGAIACLETGDAVYSVAFSPDEKMLASGNGNGAIKLWDMTTFKEIITLPQRDREVYSVAFSPDGKMLASGSRNVIRLWDMTTFKEITGYLPGREKANHSVAFSPDGKMLASGGGSIYDTILGIKLWGTIKLWDITTFGEITSWQGHTQKVRSIAFSPDGKILASGGGYPDGTIKLWDITTFKEITTLQVSADDGKGGTDTQTITITVIDVITFDLMLSAGLNLISLPLANAIADVSGEAVTISRVSSLGRALGDAWTIITSSQEGKYQSFFPDSPETVSANVNITGATGLLVGMKRAVSLRLSGQGWMVNDVPLTTGINMIGIPLQDSSLVKVSDLMNRFGNDVNMIVSLNSERGWLQGFFPDSPITSPSNVAIDGGMGFIVVTKSATSLPVAGEPWSNYNRRVPLLAAPQRLLAIDNTTTPVMELDGRLLHPETGFALNNISVNVRYLPSLMIMTDTTGSAMNTGEFSITMLDLVHNHVVRVGDTFEVSFHDASGNFSFEPIRHVVSATDIQRCRIALGDVIVRSVPTKFALLPNFPNPFNPETWLPFQLSQDSQSVILSIYDVHGRLVRTLTLGYVPAGIYQTKTRAIYWDGTNDTGELVASGIYFYHLRAGALSVMRKMLLVK